VQGGAPDTVHLRTRDPFAVLAALHEREVRTVWLEGGPVLAGAFWRAGLVDEVLAYVAPALLGSGPAAVGDLGVTTIGDAVRLVPVAVEQLFPDVLITADVHRHPEVHPDPNRDRHPREGGR
jgi:diaminohydroxyphosphoribosylaminopyrimidine deaminase / 5-amino-6-(5-phosphoribosylamino)uracil reductase